MDHQTARPDGPSPTASAWLSLSTTASQPACLRTSRTPDALAKGRYLVVAADCEACHTKDGGAAFAGGRPFETDFGTIYSPNITPDAGTGIGA